MTRTTSEVRPFTHETLPLPGTGRTRERWRRLTELGRFDLALAKVVEPHHDAVAILHDLAPGTAGLDTSGEVWAVWAAAAPFARLEATRRADGWRLHGRKAFCSGADAATSALVTATDDGVDRLFAIRLPDSRVTHAEDAPTWAGPGMSGAGTTTLEMDDVNAVAVGEPGAYLDRPGFWHGAIGVAACWYGGALAVAEVLETSTRLDAHGLAHRGAVRADLLSAEGVLDLAARRIDEAPTDDAEGLALAVRSTVADVCERVVSHVGRATGPAPLAFDGRHAQRVADLQVFVRQHHAERDLERVGLAAAVTR